MARIDCAACVCVCACACMSACMRVCVCALLSVYLCGSLSEGHGISYQSVLSLGFSSSLSSQAYATLHGAIPMLASYPGTSIKQPHTYPLITQVPLNQGNPQGDCRPTRALSLPLSHTLLRTHLRCSLFLFGFCFVL